MAILKSSPDEKLFRTNRSLMKNRQEDEAVWRPHGIGYDGSASKNLKRKEKDDHC